MRRSRLSHRVQAWLPPETGNADQPGPSSNVYAFGMLMYELMFRREPDIKVSFSGRLRVVVCWPERATRKPGLRNSWTVQEANMSPPPFA